MNLIETTANENAIMLSTAKNCKNIRSTITTTSIVIIVATATQSFHNCFIRFRTCAISQSRAASWRWANEDLLKAP